MAVIPAMWAELDAAPMLTLDGQASATLHLVGPTYQAAGGQGIAIAGSELDTGEEGDGPVLLDLRLYQRSDNDSDQSACYVQLDAGIEWRQTRGPRGKLLQREVPLNVRGSRVQLPADARISQLSVRLQGDGANDPATWSIIWRLTRGKLAQQPAVRTLSSYVGGVVTVGPTQTVPDYATVAKVQTPEGGSGTLAFATRYGRQLSNVLVAGASDWMPIPCNAEQFWWNHGTADATPVQVAFRCEE